MVHTLWVVNTHHFVAGTAVEEAKLDVSITNTPIPTVYQYQNSVAFTARKSVEKIRFRGHFLSTFESSHYLDELTNEEQNIDSTEAVFEFWDDSGRRRVVFRLCGMESFNETQHKEHYRDAAVIYDM